MFVSIVFPVAQWSPFNSFSFFNFSPWIERFLEDWDFSLDRYAPINSKLQDPPPLPTPSPHPLSTRAFEILNASAKIPAEFWGGRGGGGRGVESSKCTRDLWWSLFWCLNTWPAWSSSGMCRSQTYRKPFGGFCDLEHAEGCFWLWAITTSIEKTFSSFAFHMARAARHSSRKHE